MQLVYIWVEEYDGLKDFGINLSSKYSVNFDKQSNELRIHETQEEYVLFKVITGEYNCVNDLVALVGANGTGKTTILRLINSLHLNIDGNCIVVYLENDKLYYNSNIENMCADKNKVKQCGKYAINTGMGIQGYDLMQKSKTILFSNVFDDSNIESNHNFVNISTNELIDNFKLSQKHNYTEKTLKYLIDFLESEYVQKLDICKKASFFIVVQDIHKTLKPIADNDNLNAYLGYLFQCLFTDNSKKSKIINSFLITHICDIFNKKSDEILHILKSGSQHNDISESTIEKFFDCLLEDKRFSDLKLKIESVCEIYRWICCKDNVNYNGEISHTKVLEFTQKLSHCEDSVVGSITAKTILLSSGEIAQLNMYSRFYSLLTNRAMLESQLKYKWSFIDEKDKEFTIIIDECDVYLHPEWQRSFLKDLFEMCESLFRGKQINFIITTHSPIILSDIPKDNIVYLSKDSDNKISTFKCETNTFGANIYNLYSSSFFLDKKDNVIMGDIATERIKYVRDKIFEIKESINQSISNSNFRINIESDLLNNCTNIVSAIGEDVVKNYLQSELNYINEKIFETDSNDLNVITDLYKKLPPKDKEKFIQFIVDSNKQH